MQCNAWLRNRISTKPQEIIDVGIDVGLLFIYNNGHSQLRHIGYSVTQILQQDTTDFNPALSRHTQQPSEICTNLR